MTKSINTKFSRPLLLLIFFILFCCLSGCGGSIDTAPTPTPTPTTPTAASLNLLVSSPTLNSSGSQSVTLMAIVKDSSNITLKDQAVLFSATSGAITVISNTTDASGQATATLTTDGDKTNRTITITAICGDITATNSVNVIGTSIDVSGQDSVGSGANANYTITLKDSAGAGIPSKTVTISSSNGNTLNPTSFTTNDSGVGTVIFTGTVSGTDTLTASGLGAIGQKTITVSGATQNLSFTTPTTNAEIPIKTPTAVTVRYTNTGSPVVGVPVSFTTSRGVIGSSDTTSGTGYATVNIDATTVGAATITASVSGGPSVSLNIAFISTTPDHMTLQADPSTISTNNGTSTTQRSLLTAIVRDASNNLVKNQVVNFTLLEDPSGGDLTSASATTDSGGKASVTYIAGTTSSSTNGVKVQATVKDTSITATTNLTVNGIALFISIGTGPKIVSLTDQTYLKNFDVKVTDAGGNNVEGAKVTARATSVAYLKGYWVGNAIISQWVMVPTLTSTHNDPGYADPILDGFDFCLNEDMQYWGDASHTSYLQNGILDPGEDYNLSDALDPGSIAGITTPVTTDSNGIATLGVSYLKIYAFWVFVRLDVTVTVSGTEGKAHTTFLLPAAKGDYPYPDTNPPDSPFGKSTTCGDIL